MTKIQKEILSILKVNPEGVTLPEIGYVMGVYFVVLIKPMKQLMSDGLVEKRENYYYLLEKK